MKKSITSLIIASLLMLPFEQSFCLSSTDDKLKLSNDGVQYIFARTVPASEVFGKNSTPHETQQVSNVQQTKEELWRKELSDEKTLRTVYWVLGIGGMVGGTVLGIQGYQEEMDEKGDQDCKDVGGGYFECTDKPNTSLSSKSIIGILAFIGGLGFVFGAVGKNKLVKQLEENGRKNGFSFGMDPNHLDQYKLEYAFHFGEGTSDNFDLR